jgi:hypothetical protein
MLIQICRVVFLLSRTCHKLEGNITIVLSTILEIEYMVKVHAVN